jgi:hypothetical protein
MDMSVERLALAPAVLFTAALLGACDSGISPEPKVSPAPPGPGSAAQSAAPAVKPDPDAALAAKVRAALVAAPGLNGHAFDVTAREGRVSLFGTAASEALRRQAGELAAGVSGVASVDNQIKIVSGS